ncbi:hypothetical protein ES332_D12G123600v1 [Gossypium tomentosum]|uniref:Enolpyruvate transferase domain-containing protein n=1 Tax=Gossypium tomentosum TaxID=34277 RepID=A0A5D2I913_GOSTO|nr:hypothetical protein ES332_D12G123600v1 [Gossypium tomentosum]
MLVALKKLGVNVEHDNDEKRAVVKGCRGRFPVEDMEGQEIWFFLGNAGTAIRLLTAVIASASGSSSYILDGIPRMRERSIGDLVTGLKQLGVDIDCTLGTNCPPVYINGKGGLPGGKMKLSGSISSRYLSASLMAAHLAHRDVEIEIIDRLISSPYVEMTIKVMERFGVTVEHTNNLDRFFIRGGQKYNASYFLAGAAVRGGTVTVEGCGTSSLQGDVKFAEMMGAKVTWTETSVTVTGPPKKFIEEETLAWRVKETERMIAICTELRKHEAMVEEGPDYCVITPPEKLNVTVIDTVTSKDPGCTRKTFPEYFKILKRVTKH